MTLGWVDGASPSAGKFCRGRLRGEGSMKRVCLTRLTHRLEANEWGGLWKRSAFKRCKVRVNLSRANMRRRPKKGGECLLYVACQPAPEIKPPLPQINPYRAVNALYFKAAKTQNESTYLAKNDSILTFFFARAWLLRFSSKMLEKASLKMKTCRNFKIERGSQKCVFFTPQ